MLNQLHFLQPYWLLALIPLAVIWWLMIRSKVADAKAWAKVIDANLLPLLLSDSNEKHDSLSYLGKLLLAVGWIVATLALADPVWEKIPRPVFQTNSARIIVLDLSSSMLIADLKPSRLARARFKIEDILSENVTQKEEGQIGLVLFAGAAFTASPLTRDSETIRALLQVLTPRIMPSQGSRVHLGLKRAHELLTQAGVNNGQILLIADGVSDKSATLSAAQAIRKSGHTLSVLGVGTEAGGILPALKYRNGKKITVKLESETLQAIAQKGGGKYHLISTNNSDLKRLLSTPLLANKPQEKSDDFNSQDWKSTGPFILLLLLPIAALAFRRGWLFTIFLALAFLGVLQPQPIMAASLDEPQSQPLLKRWNNLWSNKEQQADMALKEQQYEKAIALSEKPLMRGTAEYRKQDYEKALENFKQAQGADARYNEGNTLAKMGKYQEAIKAYDNALQIQAKMEDAIKNKAAIEKLLKQKNKSKKDKGDGKKKEGKPGEEGEGENEEEKGEEGKDDKKSKGKDSKQSKDRKNQFSDANKKLDKKQNEIDEADKKDKKPSKKDSKDKEKNSKNASANKDETKKEAEKNVKNKADDKRSKSEAKELTKEEKMAAEQWLRRIPDDPGGLLRRKFQRQYQQRRPSNDNDQPW